MNLGVVCGMSVWCSLCVSVCMLTVSNNNNVNVYLKSNFQTSSMDCTYKLIKDNKYHVNVQVNLK